MHAVVYTATLDLFFEDIDRMPIIVGSHDLGHVHL